MLSDIPSYLEFTALFDAYRINKVVLKITPFCTSSTTQSTAANLGQVSCLLHSVVDRDDATLPTASSTGINELREYPAMKTTNMYANGGRAIKIKYVPRIAMAAYSGAFTSYARSKANQWLDCNSTTIQNYGIKGVFETIGNGTIQNMYFQIEAKYYLSFKEFR